MKGGKQEAVTVAQQSARLQEMSLSRQVHLQRKKGYVVVQRLQSRVPKSQWDVCFKDRKGFLSVALKRSC